MKAIATVLAVVLVMVTATGPAGSAAPKATTSQLRPELSALEFLVGSCWRGRFPKETNEDTHCFEPVFGGQHLRDTHEVTGDEEIYRGETIYSWSNDSNSISFVYWNSLGDVTTGTAVPGNGFIRFDDETYTSPDGITYRIRSRWEGVSGDSYDLALIQIAPDGTEQVRRTRYSRVGH